MTTVSSKFASIDKFVTVLCNLTGHFVPSIKYCTTNGFHMEEDRLQTCLHVNILITDGHPLTINFLLPFLQTKEHQLHGELTLKFFLFSLESYTTPKSLKVTIS